MTMYGSWERGVPTIVGMLLDENPATVGAGLELLKRAARIADSQRAGLLVNEQLWDSLQGPPVAVDAMLWAAARMLVLDNLGYSPTQEMCKHMAEQIFRDGDDCITEDEATEFAVWFACRNEEERWAACAGSDVGGTVESPVMAGVAANGDTLLLRVPPAPHKVLNALFNALSRE